jgi:proline dehydrogenase
MFARRLPTRAFSTKFRPPITRGRKVAIASGATLTVTLLALNQPLVPSHHADDFASLKDRHFQSDSHQDGSSSSLAALVRAYTVYSMCSIPFLVDHAHDILSALRSIPGAKQLTDAFVRATFFSQVCLIVSSSSDNYSY